MLAKDAEVLVGGFRCHIKVEVQSGWFNAWHLDGLYDSLKQISGPDITTVVLRIACCQGWVGVMAGR